jgi:hypothetical protein
VLLIALITGGFVIDADVSILIAPLDRERPPGRIQPDRFR